MLPSPSSTEQQEDEPLLREPHVGSTVTASFVFSNLSTADVEHSVQHDLTDLNWIYVLHSLEFLCSYGDTRSFLTASVTELHSLAASGSGKFRIVLQSCMSLLTHTHTDNIRQQDQDSFEELLSRGRQLDDSFEDLRGRT